MRLEIVTHCWRYSRLLTYQLSSLVLFPPREVSVTMTVFHTPEDAGTLRVLEFFAPQRCDNVVWRWWPLERRQLLRRAIGRNLAARRTGAEWVWFADADMVFGEGSLDALPRAVSALGDPGAVLVFPRVVFVSDDPASGEAHIARAGNEPRLLEIQRDAFLPRRYRRAIGGVQIVRGAAARRVGYCRSHPRHQRPAEHWQPTRCDVAFRRSLGTPGVAIDLPHVYRLRHSRRGQEDPTVRL